MIALVLEGRVVHCQSTSRDDGSVRRPGLGRGSAGAQGTLSLGGVARFKYTVTRRALAVTRRALAVTRRALAVLAVRSNTMVWQALQHCSV